MNRININIKTGCDIPMPSESIKLGQFIRWGKNKRYYAIGFENGTLFGDWVTNTKVFKAKDGKTHLSKKVIANIRNQNEKRIEEMYAEKALEVQALLNGLTERPIDHPYLVRKGITGKLPDDIKLQAPNMIVIPFYDSQHKISTCQFINEQGHKMFYKGAKKQGSSYSFESKTNNPKIVGLCEGFATGYSLKACLGDEAFIAVAGDAGNLPVVAESVKKRFPDKTLVTFADNDAGKRINGKPYNAGLEAAHAVNPLIYPYKILFPSWTPEIHQSVDWNDIFCNVDIEVMRSKIKKALEENSKEVEVVFTKKGGFRNKLEFENRLYRPVIRDAGKKRINIARHCSLVDIRSFREGITPTSNLMKSQRKNQPFNKSDRIGKTEGLLPKSNPTTTTNSKNLIKNSLSERSIYYV